MRARVEQTAQPGTGVRHDMMTELGRSLGAPSRRRDVLGASRSSAVRAAVV
ncbi:hypothetical protein [Micromonospora craniellae]|uniref:hypothetical protein n=1 Tax=Micromonospora craniellae TaxID=2294034 RepID=UPI001CC3D3AD|nr:hypothetical protein [Micromonospora craniellae]